MRNLTDVDSGALLSIIHTLGANPSKVVANVQLALSNEGGLNKVLVLYADMAQGWDYDWRCIYSTPYKEIEHLILPQELKELEALDSAEFLSLLEDFGSFEEYEYEEMVLEEQHEAALRAELNRYNHARMMGWE